MDNETKKLLACLVSSTDQAKGDIGDLEDLLIESMENGEIGNWDALPALLDATSWDLIPEDYRTLVTHLAMYGAFVLIKRVEEIKAD